VLGGVAKTGSDGKFVVTGAKGDSGLVPGKYKVTVSKGVLKTPSGEESVGAVIEEIDLKDEFPPIYSNPSKTVLSYSVTGDGKPIEIKLDSKTKNKYTTGKRIGHEPGEPSARPVSLSAGILL
jgi:hypothetical protein